MKTASLAGAAVGLVQECAVPGDQANHIPLARLRLEPINHWHAVESDAAIGHGRFRGVRAGAGRVGLGPLIAQTPLAEPEEPAPRRVCDQKWGAAQATDDAVFKPHVGRAFEDGRQSARLGLVRGVLDLQLIEVEVPALFVRHGHDGDLVKQSAIAPTAPDGGEAVLDEPKPERLQRIRGHLLAVIHDSEAEIVERIARVDFASHAIEITVADRAKCAPFVGVAVPARCALLETRVEPLDLPGGGVRQPGRQVVTRAEL